jgi:hypothetical protein
MHIAAGCFLGRYCGSIVPWLHFYSIARMPSLLKKISLLSLMLCPYMPAHAQLSKWLRTVNDSSYISDHTKDLTVRLYGSRKYTSYRLSDRQAGQAVVYKPNGNFNLGVGFNYKVIGINLGFNFPFINNDNERYGRTRYLDLQSHLYLRKLTVDLWAQFYRGYYISNPNGVLKEWNDVNVYPQRQDIRTSDIGINVQYIFNDRRFSFRSAFLQNEYQKKSAGSFMAGGSIYAVYVRADSSVVPSGLKATDFFNNEHFNNTNIYSLSVDGGYAHTFVVAQHFFVTLSLMGGIGANYTLLENAGNGMHDAKLGLQLNTTARCALGYNSERYYAGIYFVDMITRSNAPVPGAYQEFGAGNFRVCVAKRFRVKRSVARKVEKRVDEVLSVPVLK